MGLRGVIRGRTIELEQEPPLPDGTQVEVDLHPATDPLFDRLCALWQLNLTEPLPSLEEARQQAAQALAPTNQRDKAGARRSVSAFIWSNTGVHRTGAGTIPLDAPEPVCGESGDYRQAGGGVPARLECVDG